MQLDTHVPRMAASQGGAMSRARAGVTLARGHDRTRCSMTTAGTLIPAAAFGIDDDQIALIGSQIRRRRLQRRAARAPSRRRARRIGSQRVVRPSRQRARVPRHRARSAVRPRWTDHRRAGDDVPRGAHDEQADGETGRAVRASRRRRRQPGTRTSRRRTSPRTQRAGGARQDPILRG